jgi:F420-dependent oxidoreductase-like protein
MIEVAIMLEGQNGLNWPRWQRIARVVEDAGFAGLYRSDHFTNANPPDQDSLELWVSLTWLASHTRRIEFGPMVSPFSFRHPAITARMASAVDDLSGGRLVLGLGAGWQEREHDLYGFDLLDPKARFDRFEEGLEVVNRLLRSDGPVSYRGEYFQLQDATLLPRPSRPGGPRIAIGGNGQNRTLPLVVRYADEWNAVYLTAGKLKSLNDRLDSLLEAAGRPRDSVRRSVMLGCIFGRTAEKVTEKLTASGRTLEEWRELGAVVGNGGQVREQLQEVEQAGIQRVMLQWLDLDDLEGLSDLARELI